MYGRMSSRRDSMQISTGKSSEFKKSWNWVTMACFSSSDFKEKLTDEAKTTARMEPSFKNDHSIAHFFYRDEILCGFG